MSDRLGRIYRLLKNQKSRASYVKAKLAVLVPAQIRALRLKSTNPPMPFQRDLAREAEVHQSRISMFETPGSANITLDTLAKIAAALRVGVIVKFVPFHEMLRWENSFSPDAFNVNPRLEEDEEFINPLAARTEDASSMAASSTAGSNAGASPIADDLTKAENARKPMGSEQQLIAVGAAAGGA
jgi:transcriptional regulator with XRE-family HTH domain